MNNKFDFEELLEKFKKQQPSELQIKRWQSALYKKILSRPWYYAAAGLVAGLALGLIFSNHFGQFSSEPQFSATYVQSNVNNL